MTFEQFINYLRDELSWPIKRDSFEEIDDLFFDFSPEELGIDAKNAPKIKEIKRLRPLSASQPWGIFFVKFERKRLPVMALRCILAKVAKKNRASSNRADRAAWAANDLLFVSNYGEDNAQQISLAHFSEAEGSDLPVLKVIGWDESDAELHRRHTKNTLSEKLAWPSDPDNLAVWRERWRSAFTLRHREPITTAEDLAQRLAALANNIRESVKQALEIENSKGPITQLMKAFKEALIHDLDAKGFADTYAQTIAYGLLSARMVDPSKKTADDMLGNLRTSPFLKEMLETFLSVGGRKGKAGQSGIDFDVLGIRDVTELLDRANMEAVLRNFGDRNRREDPVMHFFEGFLQAYDKKIRQDRGVFYTPQPVVSYIVRSVHELLQSEFQLEDGLADITTWGEMIKKHPGLKLPPLTDDPNCKETIKPNEPFVQILDPATGTATFLVEVIAVIYRTLVDKWTKQRLSQKAQRAAWNEYVPKHLLPRLHAYELMMAPYAIAHLKVGLKLIETGFDAWETLGPNDRARIYLTNALEPWVKQLPLIGFDALAHEAAAVNEIKRHKRFTVVIGNPPYSDASQNMGEWTAPLIEPFRYYQQEKIKERGAIRFEHCINNDYVKFWGLTLASVAQSPFAVASLITSNTFLGGKSFRGVRDAMLGRVSRIEVLDLHGEGWAGQLAKQGVKDENVFEITTGVSITSLIKPGRNTSHAAVVYGELTGSYEEKSSVLLDPRNRIEKTPVALDPHHYCPFAPQGESDSYEYWDYPQVDTLFKASVDGIKTSRDGLVIANTREKCSEKIQAFARCTAAIDEVERDFFVSAKGFDIRSAQRHLSKNFDEGLIHPILYRPFDIRYIYYDKKLILSHRMNVMPSMFHREAWSLVFASRLSSKGFDHVIACSTLCAHKCASHDINSRMFPVVGLFQALLSRESLSSNLVDASAKMLPSPKRESEIRRASWFGEYIYAIVNAPSYRSRYHECISQDFPRIPMTTNPELALKLSEQGKLLVELHTLTASPPESMFTFSGSANDELVSPSWKDGVLRVGRSSKISGVDREIWEFRMCGYDVCKSWFSAGWKAGIQREGEPLTRLYVTQLRTLLWSVRETLRVRREIDDLIEDSGGWPIK